MKIRNGFVSNSSSSSFVLKPLLAKKEAQGLLICPAEGICAGDVSLLSPVDYRDSYDNRPDPRDNV